MATTCRRMASTGDAQKPQRLRGGGGLGGGVLSGHQTSGVFASGLLAHEYEKQLNLDAALLLNINMKGSNID